MSHCLQLISGPVYIYIYYIILVVSWLSNGTLILMLMDDHGDSERDGDDYEGALEKKSFQVPSKIEL